jgi:cytochrome P450
LVNQGDDHVSTIIHAGEPALDRTSPYPFFGYKRRTEPVWHGSMMDYSIMPEEMRPGDEWTLLDYASVSYAFRDHTRFSSAYYNSSIGLVMGPTILAMTGRQHHAHRSLVAKAFRAKSLARWEPEFIVPICNHLVAEIKHKGEADLVKSLTFEFPTRIISRLLGLPHEDFEMFRKLSFDLISIETNIETGLTASAELASYFSDQIDQRRARITDDIIGDLVGAEVDGEKLSDEAIISFLRLLLPAGLETTYRSSGNLLYLLLTHPDQFDQLRADRSLIGPAIEEGLRFESPLTTVLRTTAEDVEIGGKVIPAGAHIHVCMGAANRDEARWENSEEFDIRREPRSHISFAAGEHSCLGMHLARMETRVALVSLLDQLEDIRLAPGEGTAIQGFTFRSPNQLLVTFRAAKD